ncbi:MAG: biosynthetic peptidoglycan transglycosylase [Bacteroidota bacterium]
MNWKKTLVTGIKVIGVFFVLVVIAFFAFRNILLHRALEKVSAKVKTDYNSLFLVQDASFSGLAGVELENVILVPHNADTLFSIAHLNASISFWYALIGDVRLKDLEVKDGFVQLVKNENGRNFDVFLSQTNDSAAVESEIESGTKTNYAKLAYRLISRMLNLVPTHMSLENLALRTDDMGRKVEMHLQKLTLIDEQLQSTILVNTNTFKQRWGIQGTADPRDKKADLSFFNLDTGHIRIPYVDERLNLISGFDSIQLNLKNVDLDGDELHIEGFASIRNFIINHPKIAKKDVVIEDARFDYHFIAGADFIQLDSTSSVKFNKVTFIPFIALRTQEDTVYEMHVTIPDMQAQDFITSLPEGLFSHFKGMETMGSFNYKLDFVYNENKPQELVFESTLNKTGLRIVKYGEANLSKLNGDFVYTPMERGRPQRPILVSTANPNYTRLDQLSPYLRKCVLTTEDPSFFYHRGFIDEAFRQSIIKNIRQRKFARGASTISMQLVKNVFLTREKTISRKLEEILLVYILENNRISSKERMLEVYFNIIEWGPNVYGIGEASQFYFQKRPSELTLNECLFLATIIPRPKGFMWRFGKDGNLKEFASRQFTFLSNLMLRRAVLEPADTAYLSQPITITGPAKGFIKISADTLQTDSIIIDEEGRVTEILPE